MDNICIDCRNSADCKRKPRTNQWTVAGCSWFEIDTVITNADRIRSMTDEELARYYANRIAGCYGCEAETEDDCYKCQLAWLKSPVEVDNESP